MVKGKAVDRHVREEIVAHQILGRNARETRRLLWGPLCGMKSVPCLRSIYTVRRIWRTYGIVGISKHRSLGRGARGLSATVACIIRAWCRKPGGKRRGTRLSKLRKFLQMNPVVNRSVPRCTLCRWLKRLGLTRKKGTRVALQQDPVKVALFWTKLQLLDVDVDEAVFFDESGINTDDWNMYYGYSEKGTRFYTEERVGRGERINCLVSVCTSRTGLFCVDFVHKGSVKYVTFRDHLVNKLLPEMVRRGKKWLIMDNARWHHANNDEIVAICRLYGVTLLWMAPYHPQANPCENLFGNIKHNLPEYRDELEELAIRPRVAMLLRIFKSCAGNGNCKRWASLCGYYTNLG